MQYYDDKEQGDYCHTIRLEEEEEKWRKYRPDDLLISQQ